MKTRQRQLGGRPLAALVALWLALLVLLPSGGALAAPESAPPTMEVLEVGWDGHIAAGGWSPIRVRLTGGEVDRDLLLELWLENQYNTGPNTLVRMPVAAYAQEVSLPARATKEVQLWAPATFGLVGTVRLVAGTNLLASTPIEFRQTKAPFWPLVGVLTDQEHLGAQLRRVEIPLHGMPIPINVAQLTARALPTDPGRMKGLRAMVVQGNAPAHLGDEQRRAILAWVEAGGHLVLAGGPDSALSAAVLPAGAIPVTFAGAETGVNLSPLAEWLGSPGATLTGPAVRMAPTGGSLLAGSADRPLAWRTGLGAGTVTVLAVDPTLEPIFSHGGAPALLKRALDTVLNNDLTSEEYQWKMQMEQDAGWRLRQVVDWMPASAFPSWQQAALYLGLFALLVGPVLHLALSGASRRRWIWLAVPVASVLVAGGLYLVGVTWGGRDLIVNSASHLRLDPVSGRWNQQLMMGLYAPMKPRLTVPIIGDATVNAAGFDYGPRWGMPGAENVPVEPPFRYVVGQQNRMEFTTGSWSMRPLTMSRSLGGEAGRINAHLRLEGDEIVGTLTNDTPYRLDTAAVIVGASVAKLGDLAPGQSVAVRLTPALVTDALRYQPLSYLLLGRPVSEVRPEMVKAIMVPPGMPEPMEVPHDSEVQRRARLVEMLMQVPRRGPESTMMPLTFIAFTTEQVGSLPVELGRHPVHSLSLIEQPLHLELTGAFRLPPLLVPSEMSMQQIRGMGSASNGTISWMEIEGGSVVYTFTPPLPKGAMVTALALNTQLMGEPFTGEAMRKGMPNPVPNEPGAAKAGVFQIYNWGAATWEPLPAGQEVARLTNPAPYLGPNYQVRLQVVSGPDQWVRFVTPGLTVEGRVGP